jgi:ATP-dependent protease ClpP protease subunit
MNKPAIFAVSLLAIIVAVAIARNSDDPIPSNELRATRVSYNDKNNDLTIGGEINSATVSLVKQEFSKHPKLFVSLDSPGGSVDAGIALGRVLREHNTTVIVQPGTECASSCVFVLAGAPDRFVSPAAIDNHGVRLAAGKIGIHRPYLTDTHLTLKEVQKSASDVEAKIRAYFREMHVSQRLFDDMTTIPPGQIKWLTAQDLALYGLDQDPVVHEAYALEQARKYGLSREEYERRSKNADDYCGTIFNSYTPTDCVARAMRSGAFTPEERLNKAARDCGYSGGEPPPVPGEDLAGGIGTRNMTMPELRSFFRDNPWCNDPIVDQTTPVNYRPPRLR